MHYYRSYIRVVHLFHTFSAHLQAAMMGILALMVHERLGVSLIPEV